MVHPAVPNTIAGVSNDLPATKISRKPPGPLVLCEVPPLGSPPHADQSNPSEDCTVYATEISLSQSQRPKTSISGEARKGQNISSRTANNCVAEAETRRVDLSTLIDEVSGDAGCQIESNRVEWAKKNNLYLAQSDLAKILEDDSLPVRVFDVRDEDVIGGRIKGAVHYGEIELRKPRILKELALQALRLGEKGIVVFHCMESLRRGPRSAHRLAQLFARLPKDLPKPRIKILQGGADKWIRNYWNTPFVEDYDDEYWGFVGFPPQDSDTISIHSLYNVPDDGLSSNLLKEIDGKSFH